MEAWMLEKTKHINNPLTIIAIFAALAEISGTVALGLVDVTLQAQFLWFVMFFPVLLVLCFFITLNVNSKVLYSPSDFSDESNFMDLMAITKQAKKGLDEIEKTLDEDAEELLDIVNNASFKNNKEKQRIKDIFKTKALHFSRGNIHMQRGRYLTSEDINKMRKNAFR